MRTLLVLLFTLTTLAHAQTTFDVVSIKENKASYDGRTHIYSSSTSGNFRGVNVPIKTLLQVAYNLPETQIFGVPTQVGSAMFDLEAKVDPTFDAKFALQKEDDRREQKNQMLQAVLKERFKLAAHLETRELPVYGLILARGGAKLDPAKAPGLTVNGGYGRLSIQGASMELFAREIAKRVGRPVFDATGLSGRFDITLRWTPEEGPARLNGAPIPDPPPDLFTAIVDQLGLKLEPRKGPVSVLVVDHLEMPEQN